MKKVYQTRYGEKEGNCFQAALASLFELELEEVPDFCNIYSIETEEWYEEFLKWLQKRGYSSVPLYFKETVEHPLRYKNCLLLVTGKTQDEVNHCVIYKNGKSIHNPNKNCKGIKPETIDIIFPIDVTSERLVK